MFDAIVVGTGAGGGTALKVLCEAGLNVCAVNSGPRIVPEDDYRRHRQVYDLKYRGFGDPLRLADRPHQEPYSVEESEYSEGQPLFEPMSITPTPREQIGTGSAARPPEAKRISGDVRPRASAISISRPPTSMGSAKTGRSITRKFPLGSPRPRVTWASPARSRTGPAIRTGNICRRCPFAAWTTFCRRRARKSGFPICLIDVPS